MTRQVLIAGLLGGLLGGGAAFVSGRVSPPAAVGAPQAPDASARELPEELLQKLKSGDADQFAASARARLPTVSDQDFTQFKTMLVDFRTRAQASHGKSLGEFELVREQAAGPTARLVYLEKFERGAVAWYFTMYRAADGWKLMSFQWDLTLNVAFGP